MRSAPYTTAWDRASRAYRRAHPLCVRCQAQGKVSASRVVDHVVPHKGDLSLFWNKQNWQALCEHCHNSDKRSIELNGFDRTIGTDGWPTDPMHPANKTKK
jgi:5-methylcytosine-specific restriction endonuclease McrA